MTSRRSAARRRQLARRRAGALVVVLCLVFVAAEVVDRIGSALAPADEAAASTPPATTVLRAQPSATPSPTVQPTGELWPVRGQGVVVGTGPLQRYRVEVEGGLGVSGEEFARAVDRILADPRSWTADGRVGLQWVDDPDADFTVTLASPDLTDRLCAPLVTEGIYSCHNGERAVINSDRWLFGDDSYGSDLAGYREYVVNHEVGHAIGHGHRGCPGPGTPAPVMLQQTVGLQGCLPNPWPFPSGP